MSITTAPGAAPSSRPGGSAETAFCGMVTTTTSAPAAASAAGTAVAPVSAASSASVCGSRELLTRTS